MIQIDNDIVTVNNGDGKQESFGIGTPEAFRIISDVWLRSGWDTKYVYGFTWLGRPIIQLPDDLVRLQEVIFQIQPDVILETGIAHGGSLVFSAGICKLIGKGRVIGVDIEIRPHNRKAIEEHFLYPLITMIEGSSIAPDIVEQVKRQVQPDDTVLVFLDACHTKDHVLAELEAYGPLVSPGSYIVAMDGIMQSIVGAPRTQPDWDVNNPQQAANEFVAGNANFVIEEPVLPFNEGAISDRVTYWPNAFVKRVR